MASGLGEIEIPATNSSFFKIYPNPNLGVFTLELYEVEALSGIRVEIYSLFGEKVKQIDLEGQLMYEFNLSTVPQGIYLIRVTKGNVHGFIKLVRK